MLIKFICGSYKMVVVLINRSGPGQSLADDRDLRIDLSKK